jgi:hypothetical protein
MLAGASWMGEYGDPDTADFDAYISKYSPYHNVPRKGEMLWEWMRHLIVHAGWKGTTKLPRVFFSTSTKGKVFVLLCSIMVSLKQRYISLRFIAVNDQVSSR